MFITNIRTNQRMELTLLDEVRVPWDRGVVVSFEGHHPALKGLAREDIKVGGVSHDYTLGASGDFVCGVIKTLTAPAAIFPNADTLLHRAFKQFHGQYHHPTGIIEHELITQVRPPHVGAGVLLVKDTNVLAFGRNRQSGDALSKEEQFRRHALVMLEELGYVQSC